MKSIKISIVSALLTFVMSAAWAESVNVYIPGDVLKDYEEFLAGRSPLDITEYNSRRDVVEVILFQQALAETGNRFQLNFVEEGDYAKVLDGLERGDAIANVTSLWRKDLSPRWNDLYITTAVIERGQFEAGFYTLPTNRTALSSRTNDQIKALRGVSSDSWVIDWKTLTNFGANVSSEDEWNAIVGGVFSGKYDYTLAPFQSTADLSFKLEQGTLVPIPNVKIALMGTRHFAVSRAHPLGWEFNTSLHRGLMALKKEGTVVKAYEDCGFLNPNTREWREVTASNR